MLEVRLEHIPSGRNIGIPKLVARAVDVPRVVREIREGFPDEKVWDVTISGEEEPRTETYEERTERWITLAALADRGN